MTSPAKVALLLFVFAVCALGAVFAPTETNREDERNIPVTPVNNRQPQHHTWLRV